MATVNTNTSNITQFVGTAGSNAGGIAQPGGYTLTQNDFLNLLVEQLKNQDPTNPESNLDFASQMAQFSSLSAMNNLSTSMGQFAEFSQLSDGASLIGATVTTTATDSSGNMITGPVSSVSVSNGAVSVTVNGQSIPLTEITGVAPTQVGTSG